MILTCPACKTRFEIDVARLGAKSRLVRCGHCGHKWRQARDDFARQSVPRRTGAGFKGGPRSATSTEAPLRGPAADHAARPSGPAWADRPPRDRITESPANWAGWLLLLAFLAAVGSVAFFGRDMLVAKIPPISRLYALAGLSVNLPKDRLSLENVTSVRRLISGDRVLIIEGEVLNTSDGVVPLPPLKARLEDEDGNELSSWTFYAEDEELGPGESARFETSTRNPPKAGKN
ncbi:MAG TPA: DUF3426 domain-containing protein, partial [Kiloniellaceae bacterium]|nr:DUF3426 domain-containing protein [Kiloniellaceae bacterium]